MHSDPHGAETRGPGHAAHAAGRGPSASSSPNSATDLSAARDALVSGSGRTRRLDTRALRDALVDLFDFWLTTEGSELGIRPDSGFALVAVGGLGRREMLPHSDVDLILLHDNIDPETVSSVADRLWYPLWDAHIRLDHSVRTVPQALQVASSDLPAALGMLEARHIAGDQELSNLLIGGVRSSGVPGYETVSTSSSR